MMTDDARRAAIVQAERVGLDLPAAAVAGVVANLDLLAQHHAKLRAALAQAPQA